MKTPSPLLVALSCAVALLLWAAVLYVAWTIASELADASAAAAAGASARAQQLEGSEMLVLSSATAAGREELMQILNTDVLSLAGELVAAGHDAGVTLAVSNATPEPAPSAAALADIHPILLSFNVQADGSFEKLFKATALLETLPAASYVDSVGFSSGPGGAAPWHMNADIRAFTVAPISP